MYKESIYNYFIDYNNKKLLFNGLTGNCFCMTKQEYENLTELMMNMEQFQEKYPYDFERLQKLGYLIKDDFDEVSYILFKNRESVFSGKDYSLIINPTLNCNFRCWYCYEEHKGGKMSTKTINNLKKHIRYMIEKKKISSLRIGWFGGEPLLCFDSVVYPVSQYAKKICKKYNIPYSSNITTNGYLINEEMITNIKEIELFNYQITLDGNKEKHDKVRNNNGKQSYDTIINNIKLLCNNIDDLEIFLRINYDDQTFNSENIFSILDEFAPEIRKNIIINPHRIWQTYREDPIKDESYFSKFMQMANEKGYRIKDRCGLNIGTFSTCYASRMNYANVNFDGKIYKCTARNYSEDNSLGEMKNDGTINWDMAKISKMYCKSPLDNIECLGCKYLPLCYGQYVQNFKEQGNYCYFKNNMRFFEDEIIRYYSNFQVKINE